MCKFYRCPECGRTSQDTATTMADRICRHGKYAVQMEELMQVSVNNLGPDCEKIGAGVLNPRPPSWLLDYKQCEAMKSVGHRMEGGEILVDYAHWCRFLRSIVYTGLEPPVSFPTYRQWLKDYDGWSYGYLDAGHAGWKKEWANMPRPMNYFYMSAGARLSGSFVY